MKEYTIYYTDTLHGDRFDTSLKCYDDKDFIQTLKDLHNDTYCTNIYAVSGDGNFPQEYEEILAHYKA